MRIAMVSEHASPLADLGEPDAGGQNVHVAALARALARLGHEVEVYTRRDDPDLPTRVTLCAGATVVHVPVGPAARIPKDDLLPHMVAFGEWVADDWERHGAPDVVHAHFWMSGIAALRARRRHRVPVVQTFHALGSVKRRYQREADTSPVERLAVEQELAHDVDLVVATCRDEVAELAAMGVPGDHVRVVPCGVDTERFRPGPGAVPAGSPHRLLVVGRMVERKGFDLAVRMLPDLPDTELVVAGGPPRERLEGCPQARRLRDLAEELGVADRVRLVGQVAHADMPGLYRSADVVLALPWYEPFGITPLEAAACGRPVVAAATGGLQDTVADGITGRLVPPRDVGAAVRAVREILDDPERAARMGVAARQRAVSLYDWSQVARRTEQLLHAVSRPPRARGAQDWLTEHVAELSSGMASLVAQTATLQAWGERLAEHLGNGGRMLVAGNGGSAGEAQHFAAELVCRFREDRRPLSAIALTAESSSLTAILNDYGPEEVFARQVEAHGRPGDVVVLLSTSGSSTNVLYAARRAREVGVTVWALTGPGPNPLTGLADDAVVIDAPSTAAVQEVHLAAIHGVCAALDVALGVPHGGCLARGAA